MLQLRKILLCNYLYYLIFGISIIFVIYKINIPYHGKDYSLNKSFTGIVTDLYISSDKMIIEIKNKDKIRGTYYFEELTEDIHLGDNVTIYGTISLPYSQTNPNIFNYQNYLKYKNIFFIMKIDSIKKNHDNRNIFYAIKNTIISSISHNSSFKYLYLFILGDNRYLDENIKKCYQSLGISHLFSVSGMHMSIISTIVLKLLKKLKITESKSLLITCLFIILYMFLVNFCPSALRSGIFFILLTINTIFYFYIKPINILLLTISIILLINPYIIYNTGFLYSSIITASLIIFSDLINRHSNSFIKIIYTSLIAFFFSLPISIYNYYQINIMSILYNLIFVPLVSTIIFPLSLICFFIKPMSIILNILIYIMENMALKLSIYNLNIILYKPSILVILIYYIIIFLCFKFRKKCLYVLLLFFIFIHYNYNILIPSNYILMIDIGQGDSILLHSGNKNILVDTGGILNSSTNLTDNTLIPLFKSLGIRKIDYLFLTHGDYDHVGETINLINNFKIEKVYFNEGKYSSNEKRIIDTLNKKNIFYDICRQNDYYKIGQYELYSLNSDLNDENDSSLILYGIINNYNFILMGDASKNSEQKLLNKYNISDIDILKVGHHGSNTSTSEEFIEAIKPKYAIISAGKDNKFGHPHQETLNILKKYNVKVFTTNLHGAILIKFNKNVTFSTFGT